MSAAIAASASPGLKMGDVIQPRNTRGSSTSSVTLERRSCVIGGVVTSTGGITSPRGIVAKYFVTSAFACTLSMSPAITSVALFGT